MRTFALLFALIIFTNCSLDDNKKEETGLIGKWKLIEQLYDPGDGSGTFKPIKSNRVIEFFSNGTVSINGDLCYMSSEIGEIITGTYEKTSDNNSDTKYDGIIIPNTCDSRSAKVYFDLPLSGNLILWYQCIEGCAQKFTKI